MEILIISFPNSRYSATVMLAYYILWIPVTVSVNITVAVTTAYFQFVTHKDINKINFYWKTIFVGKDVFIQLTHPETCRETIIGRKRKTP